MFSLYCLYVDSSDFNFIIQRCPGKQRAEKSEEKRIESYLFTGRRVERKTLRISQISVELLCLPFYRLPLAVFHFFSSAPRIYVWFLLHEDLLLLRFAAEEQQEKKLWHLFWLSLLWPRIAELLIIPKDNSFMFQWSLTTAQHKRKKIGGGKKRFLRLKK